MIIDQYRVVQLIHIPTSKSSRLHVPGLRRCAFIQSYYMYSGNVGAEDEACQHVLGLCAESLEELTVCEHL